MSNSFDRIIVQPSKTEDNYSTTYSYILCVRLKFKNGSLSKFSIFAAVFSIAAELLPAPKWGQARALNNTWSKHHIRSIRTGSPSAQSQFFIS